MKILLSPPVLFLLMLQLFPHCSAESPDQELIHTTCMHTPYYDLCISIMRSKPMTSITDVRGMAHVIARVALLRATETLNHIKVLLDETKSLELQPRLRNCLKLYTAIVTELLPEAIEGLDTGNNKFAYQGAIDTATLTDSCNKMFKDASCDSPISDRNQAVHDLSVIVASVVNILLTS